jgi:hypothetical protein
MNSRNCMLVTAVLISGVLFSFGPARATVYYVSKTGNDANLCTQAQPCLTIQHGVNVAAGPGNILYVESGTYTPSDTITIATGGSSGNPFIVQGFAPGGSCPTTTGDKWAPNGNRPAPTTVITSSVQPGFNIFGSYVRFDCFDIRSIEIRGATLSSPASNVDIWNNVIHPPNGADNYNIVMLQAGATTLSQFPQNVTIKGNYIYNGEFGIVGACQNNCLIQDNEFGPLYYAPSTTAGVSNMRFWGNNVTINHNYFHGNDAVAGCSPDYSNCHYDALHSYFQPGNPGYYVMTNLTFTRNVSFNQSKTCVYLEDDSNNTESGGPLGTYGSYNHFYNITIENNVCGFDPYPGTGQQFNIVCGWFYHAGNVTFNNNTCVTGVIIVQNNSQVTQLENNIVAHADHGYGAPSCTNPIEINETVSSPIPGDSSQILEEKNNLFHSSCTISQSAFPNDIVNQSPQFVFDPYPDAFGDQNSDEPIGPSTHDFHLASGSPAIAAGATDTGVTVDITGATRPSPPSIGAYEFGVGTSAGPQPPSHLLATVN